MKKIILIAMIMSTALIGHNENHNVNELVGAYILEKPLEASVIVLNNDSSLSYYSFNKLGWSEENGKWGILNNELCVSLFDDNLECADYELIGDILIIYNNPDNRGDVLKKVK